MTEDRAHQTVALLEETGAYELQTKERCPEGNVLTPKLSGDFVEEAIPDPIPNSEVKLLRANGTAWGICVGE